MKKLFFGTDCLPVDRLDLDDIPRGTRVRLALELVEDATSSPLRIPLVVIRGEGGDGVFGLTAAVHGNELNGIRVIQRALRDLDPKNVHGTIVGCPLINVPGFRENRREIYEGIDLNRIMPGNPRGNVAQVYADALLTRVLDRFDYLIDLHTASFGRENSLYVRANLENEVTREMAFLQAPEIIVHNEADDGTVRGAVMNRGAAAITVEVGNPQRFQKQMILESVRGVRRTLARFGFLRDDAAPSSPASKPLVCRRSFWIYATGGGLLEVRPNVGTRLAQGERFARTRNLFGDVLSEYFAPDDGVVIGRSTNPVCRSGARVVHFGTDLISERAAPAGGSDER